MNNIFTSAISALVLAALLAGVVLVVVRRRYGFAASVFFVGNHGYDADTGVGLSVTEYPGNASGDTPPTGEFNGDHVSALARDSAGNFYVASDNENEVKVYPPTQTGRGPSMRTIFGLNTGLHRPTGLAFDAAGNLYVADQGGPTNLSAILVFAPGADGDVPPIASIPAAPDTGFSVAGGVAVDDSGNIYVAGAIPDASGNLSGRLLIFRAGANGNVAPMSVITNGLVSPQQVALDLSGNIYVVDRDAPASIVLYAPRAATGSAPTGRITNADMTAPFGLAVDAAGNIYVANTAEVPDPTVDCVLVFARASGNTWSVRKVQGPNTRLVQPLGLTL
jgi:sugar lactone lactonase YvrE